MKPRRSFYWGTAEAGLPDLPLAARWLPVEGPKPPRIERLLLTWRSQERTPGGWEPEVGIEARTIYDRIVVRGWDVELALTVPPGPYDVTKKAEMMLMAERDVTPLLQAFRFAGIRVAR